MRINSNLVPFTKYSTTETAIGEWIDGKTIYRKTIYISSLPQSTWANYPHNISNIDSIINIYGFMKTPSNGTTVAFNFIGTSALYGTSARLLVRADKTNVVIETTSNWSNVMYVTLEYTKT